MILKWHRRARQDLVKVRAYIARENPKAAAKVAKRILESVARLPDSPAIGLTGRLIGTRELIVTDTPYLLPYTVGGEEIVILRVLHGTQTWPTP